MGNGKGNDQPDLMLEWRGEEEAWDWLCLHVS